MDPDPLESQDAKMKATARKESFVRKVRFFESVSRSPMTTINGAVPEETDPQEVKAEK